MSIRCSRGNWLAGISGAAGAVGDGVHKGCVIPFIPDEDEYSRMYQPCKSDTGVSPLQLDKNGSNSRKAVRNSPHDICGHLEVSAPSCAKGLTKMLEQL